MDIVSIMSINENDKRLIRCRMLGHEVDFAYCRQGSGDLPCRKILDCWFERFDIEEFIHHHYTPKQVQEILEPSKPKLTSLVDLIRQAQKTIDQKKPE